MSASGGRNPVLPADVFVPDPEAHVVSDGRLFVYGSLDGPDDEYCSDRYRPVSTADLREWVVHEPSFHAGHVGWYGEKSTEQAPFAQPQTPFMLKTLRGMGVRGVADLIWTALRRKPARALLYAPDAIEHAGRHYLYFCMTDGSEGVAVADRPEGPFGDPVRLPATGIDPAVFTDRDGTSYYYWGQWSAHGVALNEDRRSFDEGTVVRALLTEQEHHFHEGSSMRRVGDIYYLVYADVERGKPTSLGYATSSSPLGPFTYRGIIIDNDGSDPGVWNNHGSIEQVNGQWYVFYHRSSRGTRYHRRLCVEPIQILSDGSIPEVPMTSQGAGEPFAVGEVIDAFRACALTGRVRIAPSDGGDETLSRWARGDTATFRYVARGEYGGVSLVVDGRADIEIAVDGVTVANLRTQGGSVSTRPFRVTGCGEVVVRMRRGRGFRLRSLTLLAR
jgi:hypothetical protein